MWKPKWLVKKLSTQERLAALEDRLETNSTMIEEDHATLVELQRLINQAIEGTKAGQLAVQHKLTELTTRQNALRSALSEAIKDD